MAGSAIDVLSGCSNDGQFPSDRISHNPELTLTRQKKQNNHQQVSSQPPTAGKLKASNFPALFLKIGSWIWTSRNEGDLVVKFYYGKKKLVWEFLYGCRKRKIEIRWSHVSAINAFVDDDKKGRLEIELEEAPQYYKEIKFQPRKHTQWAITGDFTEGQADSYRRHTLLFSPGVLDMPFKKLLQYDNRLFNLSRQPFPTHECLDFTYNRNVYGCPSIPHLNYEHQGTVQNLLQPISSLVGHSECNLQELGMQLQNSSDIARKVSYIQEQRASVAWEQTGNNQIEDIFLPPIREKDYYLSYQWLAESWTQDQEWRMDIENVTEFTNYQQNCFNVDTSCKPFTQNHENYSNPSCNWMNDGNQLEARKDDSSSSGSVMNHMTYHDDEICSFNEEQINDLLAFLEDYKP